MAQVALRSTDAPPFGGMLREWRQHRRLSQLALALASGISQRHISFLETGRANPSRGMVLALADALDVPLRERNALLTSGGFAPGYAEADLNDDQMGLFREALQLALEHHEPYPAIVLDGRWNMVMANQGALRFFSQFTDPIAGVAAIGAPETFQMVRLCLHEAGLKPYIVNWHELVFSFLQRARRALLVNPRDSQMAELIEEILGHPEASPEWRRPDLGAPPPAITMRLRKDGRTWSLFTMLAHFGAPQDITIEELSVETFYPADAATREHLLALT
ncbi:MAG: helix-turn-helix transcriptional regulator [Pseudomonadales bacterium]